MDRRAFRYALPPELIAQQPATQRTGSRLLHLDRAKNARTDHQFGDLPRLLKSGDLLVVNDTKVIKARLLGNKETGGRAEILVERMLDEQTVLAQIRASKPPRATSVIHVGEFQCRVTGKTDDFYELRFSGGRIEEILERHGQVPLPPYITRPVDPDDASRYQTVFAVHPGAVAAPTAGLHFSAALISTLKAQNIESVAITLHVGAATFQPIRSARIDQHHMHTERFEVGSRACTRINDAIERGARIIAVGTTVVRALETAAARGRVRSTAGDTDIFIKPGYEFQIVSALITNFHLPESTLLVLVSAFAGREQVMAAYRHAVDRRYRFYSYGDAMLIT